MQKAVAFIKRGNTQRNSGRLICKVHRKPKFAALDARLKRNCQAPRMANAALRISGRFFAFGRVGVRIGTSEISF